MSQNKGGVKVRMRNISRKEEQFRYRLLKFYSETNIKREIRWPWHSNQWQWPRFYKSEGVAQHRYWLWGQLHISASLLHAKSSLLGFENCCGDDLVDEVWETPAECPIELIWLDSKALWLFSLRFPIPETSAKTFLLVKLYPEKACFSNLHWAYSWWEAVCTYRSNAER